MNTPEDTLTEDIVALWNATAPTSLPAGWNIYHHQNDATRTKPCVIVGHEGAQRVPSMPDTRKVNLRVMVLSVMDDTSAELHREVAGYIDAAIDALGTKPGNLTNTYIHDLLVESPDKAVVTDKREEYTVLKRTAVISRGTV